MHTTNCLSFLKHLNGAKEKIIVVLKKVALLFLYVCTQPTNWLELWWLTYLRTALHCRAFLATCYGQLSTSVVHHLRSVIHIVKRTDKQQGHFSFLEPTFTKPPSISHWALGRLVRENAENFTHSFLLMGWFRCLCAGCFTFCVTAELLQQRPTGAAEPAHVTEDDGGLQGDWLTELCQETVFCISPYLAKLGYLLEQPNIWLYIFLLQGLVLSLLVSRRYWGPSILYNNFLCSDLPGIFGPWAIGLPSFGHYRICHSVSCYSSFWLLYVEYVTLDSPS